MRNFSSKCLLIILAVSLFTATGNSSPSKSSQGSLEDLLQQRIQELKSELSALQEIVRLKNEIAQVKKQLADPKKKTSNAKPKPPVPSTKTIKINPSPIAKKEEAPILRSTVEKQGAEKPRKVVLKKTRAVANQPTKQVLAKRMVERAAVKKPKRETKRWEVNARALYMRPFEHKTYISPIRERELSSGLPGHTARISPRYDSGFEGRIAYNFPNSNWSLSAIGRYFSVYENDLGSTRVHGGQFPYRSKLNIGFRGLATATFEVGEGRTYAAESSTAVSSVSANAEYNFSAAPQLTALGGIKFGAIDRKLDVVVGEGKGAVAPGNEIVSDNQSIFIGIGPNFGLAIQQPIWGGFSASAKFSASVLTGVSKVRSTNQFGAGASDSSSDFEKTEFRVVPVADASIGLQYYRKLFGSVVGNVELGFTTQHWIGLRDFIRDNTVQGEGNLNDTVVGFFGPHFKARVTW